MSLSERHQRFKRAVDNLKLRFPGAELSKRTGYNKATVSAYLSDREPSENFIKTFAEQFGLDFSQLWEGNEKRSEVEGKGEPSAMQILAVLAEGFRAQAEIMRNIEKNMARADAQARAEANLVDIQGKVTTLWERQELAIEEFRETFLKVLGQQKAPSKDVHKTRDHNGGTA